MIATGGGEDFKDVKLCVKCYWETVAFWNGSGDLILDIFRDDHGTDKYADACRRRTEEVEEFLSNQLMFDGNSITTDYSAQMGRKCLDEFGLNYDISYGVTGYDDDGDPHRYRFDAYIELNGRKVGIEFDGSIHDREDVKANDDVRDSRLTRNGYIVLRFTTYELINKRSYVRSSILDAIYSKHRQKSTVLKGDSYASTLQIPK